MVQEPRPTPTQIGPAAYDTWRRTPLGALTERLEHGLIFEAAGRLDDLHVLDVGTGDGAFAVEAARRGAVVTGIDPDPAMLAAAAARAHAMDVGLQLGDGRAEQLPFADGTFDLVFSVAVLCFVADAAAAIREMARVLRPGGRLILGELNRWSSWAGLRYVKGLAGSRTWRSARFRTAAQLRRSMAAAGLTVMSVDGAVFYPQFAAAARLMAPWDRWLGRRMTFGAAFVVISARKPSTSCGGPSSIRGGPARCFGAAMGTWRRQTFTPIDISKRRVAAGAIGTMPGLPTSSPSKPSGLA
ncbi:MAG: hypothetical protein A3D94_16085 [Alphaproteobacteria bacterium RIFCSPHIGHO2_12_FULL_66_14]|jgi:SAM-dependent methyltransferase|nr:MAG: hypothetical protein A3D94_16085 [Alphaproteobacteria bacterium RIFCSPHIGHO2_12_FULL_66_14]